MSTWSYVVPLAREHAEYLGREGVGVPSLAPVNRAPSREDVDAAYAAIGQPDSIVVDTYATDDGVKVAVRGAPRAQLRLLHALAARCGQLYMFGFPHDRMPGVVVDPADDLDAVMRRMDAGTRAALDAADA